MRIITALILAMVLATLATAQTREEKVRADRERVEADGFWIYNDLPKAFATAKESGRPILVVLRCIPCEECVKLDDELVDKDPAIRPLLDQFVCARQVSTNGLDLSLFQFDTDQSFAVFMLNADGTIYGRFGTRSHRTEWLGDVSLQGLEKALAGALALHAKYPANKTSLAGKRGQPLEVASPEKFPSLKGKFTDRLNYEGNVVRSCIHCHQVGEAQRDLYRADRKPIPETVLFPFPHPRVVGWTLDPKEMATIKAVDVESAAGEAGFMAGDRIESFDGQPMLSIADVQWVLHCVDPNGGEVTANVRRAGNSVELTLTLEKNWRRAGDLSWRATSWALRRMGTGGLLLKELDDDERSRLKIDDGRMALLVEHVGQYGKHAAAKKAGFRKGDIIIEFDGRRDFLRDTDVLHHAATRRKPGERVRVTVLRNGKTIELSIPMQS